MFTLSQALTAALSHPFSCYLHNYRMKERLKVKLFILGVVLPLYLKSLLETRELVLNAFPFSFTAPSTELGTR